jgi:hypothetical protein
MTAGGNHKSPQPLRPLLALQESPIFNARARTYLIKALLISITSTHVELKIFFILCTEKEGSLTSLIHDTAK